MVSVNAYGYILFYLKKIYINHFILLKRKLERNIVKKIK